MALVLDASAMVDLLLGRPELAIHLRNEDLHVPSHFDVEVAGALRRLESSDRRRWRAVMIRARADLATLRLVRHPAVGLVDRAWELRRNLTVADGVYVALAEGLRAPLFTSDHRLARAAARLVEVIAPV